jgi:hypothetical protein
LDLILGLVGAGLRICILIAFIILKSSSSIVMCCLLGQSLDEHIRGFEISKLYLLEISFENRCYTFSEPELKADACETVIS